MLKLQSLSGCSYYALELLYSRVYVSEFNGGIYNYLTDRLRPYIWSVPGMTARASGSDNLAGLCTVCNTNTGSSI